MRSFIALSSALLLATCANAAVYFTQPIASTVWQAGQAATIRWIAANGTTLSSNPITIELLHGNPSAFTQIIPNLVTVPENAGSVNITVNATLATGNLYAIRANSTYSSLFTITNANPNAGKPANGTTPTTGTPTTGTPSATSTAKPTATQTAKSDAQRFSSASSGALVIAYAAAWSMF